MAIDLFPFTVSLKTILKNITKYFLYTVEAG